MSATVHASLARKLADLFADLPQVEAIAWGGSQIGGITDPSSDIDLYVYTQADIPLAIRQEIVTRSGGASQANVGLSYWGPGDEWFNTPTGIEIDIVYFNAQWMASQLQRVIHQCEASLGYTTCFWHIIRHSQSLSDPRGWFQALQNTAQVDYPETLRKNIIALNHPVLREVIPSYANQLIKAVKRSDLVSMNHRLSALLASYFDIIFAVNRELHPGEKRLLSLANKRCIRVPINMVDDINTLIQTASVADQTFLSQMTKCLDNLDQWLVQEGCFPLPTELG
jgi:hypothetical protein